MSNFTQEEKQELEIFEEDDGNCNVTHITNEVILDNKNDSTSQNQDMNGGKIKRKRSKKEIKKDIKKDIKETVVRMTKMPSNKTASKKSATKPVKKKGEVNRTRRKPKKGSLKKKDSKKVSRNKNTKNKNVKNKGAKNATPNNNNKDDGSYKTRYKLNNVEKAEVENSLDIKVKVGNCDNRQIPVTLVENEYYINKYSKRQPQVAINMGKTNFLHNLVYKPSLDLSIELTKLSDREERNHGWSFTKRVKNLKIKPKSLFSMHGCYNFKPEDIIKLLNKTGAKSFTFLHYAFTEGKGKINNEIDFMVPDDKAILTVKNERHKVVGNFRWILNRQSYSTLLDTLVWTSKPLGRSGYLRETVFMLTKYKIKAAGYGKYFNKNGRIRTVRPIVDKIRIPNTDVWYGNHISFTMRHKNEDQFVMIPTKVIEKTMHAATLTDTFKSKSDIISACKRAINNDRTPGVSKSDLYAVAPKIVNAVINHTTEAIIETDDFQNCANYLNRKRAAQSIKDTYRSNLFIRFIWKWLPVVLFAALTIFIVPSLVRPVVISIWFIGYMIYVMYLFFKSWKLTTKNYKQLSPLGYVNRLLKTVSRHGWIVFFMTIGGASCGDGNVSSSNVPIILSIFVISIVVIYLLKQCCRIPKNEFKFWNVFKRIMEEEDRTIPGCGSVPIGDGPDEFVIKKPIDEIRKEFGIREGCSVTMTDVIKDKRKRNGTCQVGVSFTHVYPRVFQSGAINELGSVHTRVIQKLPPICKKHNYKGWKQFTLPKPVIHWNGNRVMPLSTRFIAEKVYQFKEPYSFDGWLKKQKYPKNKADRIRKVRNSSKSYSKKDFKWDLFVKREKQLINSYDEYTFTKPRAVQGTSWIVKALAGTWAINYTSAVKFSLNPTTRYWYCSGYTPDTFHYWINRNNPKFSQPVYMVSDYSKYDVTQSDDCTAYHAGWLHKAGFLNLPYAQLIIESYRRTVGYASCFKYTAGAIMHSGSLFTSVHNTASTYADRYSFNQRYNMHKSYSAILGDDNFSIYEKGDILKRFGTLDNFKRAVVDHSAALGFQVKVIVTEQIARAEFLSCKFLPTSDGLALSKKPGRVLSKMGCFLNKGKQRTNNEWLEIFKGTLESYKSTSSHVPFLRTYINVCLGHLKHVKVGKTERSWNDFSGGKSHKANDETWEAFTDFYGLNRNDEEKFRIDLENQINKYGLTSIMTSKSVQCLYELELEL